MSHPPPLLAVTGLAAEARIAAGLGVVTIAGGGDPARLALLLQGALDRGAQAVISFGIAGGLKPGLRPGTTIIGRSVTNGTGRSFASRPWIARLERLLPEAMTADLYGIDAPAATVSDKAALHRMSGAVAVDMESHVAARLAAHYGLPFAALRIIADPAERSLPAAALVGMRPDGSTDIAAVLRALGRRPSDLPALIRTALDARAAFAALHRDRRTLCALFGFADAPADADRDLGLGADLGSIVPLGEPSFGDLETGQS